MYNNLSFSIQRNGEREEAKGAIYRVSYNNFLIHIYLSRRLDLRSLKNEFRSSSFLYKIFHFQFKNLQCNFNFSIYVINKLILCKNVRRRLFQAHNKFLLYCVLCLY